MLRARNGITSSGEAFWLIPAMRKKERKGPGMVAVAASCACTPRSSDVKERGEAAPQTPGAKLAQKHAKTSSGAEKQNGHFIAGTRQNQRDIPQLVPHSRHGTSSSRLNRHFSRDFGSGPPASYASPCVGHNEFPNRRNRPRSPF